MNMKRLGEIAIVLALAPMGCGDEDPIMPPPQQPTIAQVVVSPAADTLGEGQTLELEVTVTNSDGSVVQGATVAWSSSDEDVATVDGTGAVTAVFEGMAEITATVEGVRGTATITVLGRIVFANRSDGNWEVYAINRDGSGAVNLSNSSALDWEPIWSPDGSRIAFVSERDGNREIYLMNADGSDFQNVTNSPSNESYLAWSPDGSRIAFADRRDGDAALKIYVVDVDGGVVARLTDGGDTDTRSRWSPDGSRILFLRDPDDGINFNTDMYVVGVDGGGVTRLTYDGAHGHRWSPNGARIAFQGSGEQGKSDIYLINPDGTDLQAITNDPAHDVLPMWSPDGNRLAFLSEPSGNYDVYAMDADGGGLEQLTTTAEYEFAVRWSPDGSRIAFVSVDWGLSLSDRVWGLYVINADGSEAAKIAESPSATWSEFGWRPRP